jgi:hypothetical protein
VGAFEDEPVDPGRRARQALEAFIDEIIEGTFPASDPPAWGAAAARVERMEDED